MSGLICECLWLYSREFFFAEIPLHRKTRPGATISRAIQYSQACPCDPDDLPMTGEKIYPYFSDVDFLRKIKITDRNKNCLIFLNKVHVTNLSLAADYSFNVNKLGNISYVILQI